MKKYLVLVLFVIFVNFSFGLVRIIPNHDTEVANAIKKASAANYMMGITNPDSIYPGQVILVAINAKTGDNQWLINERVLFPKPILVNVPTKPTLPVLPKAEEINDANNPWPLWLLLFVCVVLFILFINSLFKNKKNDELHQKDSQDLIEINRSLKNELRETKNKLPIEAPTVVDENWLKNNHPIEAQTADSMLLPSDTAIAKVFGKKPDLIGQALVSTKENATIMNFSYDRKANTGLKDVVVWLGWNWAVLKKGSKKKGWVPVGLIASVCSNGFVGNPELVQSLDQLFTKIELANERNPVAYLNPNVPVKANFPSLLAGLVVKFHQGNIADLRKAGAMITLPNDEKKIEIKD